MPEKWQGKKLTLEFEGIYRNSKIYVNEVEVGGRPYGYTGFFVSMEKQLKPGQKNTIRVVADNSSLPNSRWYSGAGIYRPVWLYVQNESHIKPEGVKITTLSWKPARIRVDVEYSAKTEKGTELAVEIYEGVQSAAISMQAGGSHKAGEPEAAGCVAAGTIRSGEHSVELDIPNARLWSDESPNLYSYRVIMKEKGEVTDEAAGTFGIRKVEWSPKGLFINGKETLLRGGCVHSDNGILGACSYAKAEERRIRILKEEGYNAIRSAHNPASKAMLEACDRYGIYVMDETWDMWYSHKNKYDYASESDRRFYVDGMGLSGGGCNRRLEL